MSPLDTTATPRLVPLSNDAARTASRSALTLLLASSLVCGASAARPLVQQAVSAASPAVSAEALRTERARWAERARSAPPIVDVQPAPPPRPVGLGWLDEVLRGVGPGYTVQFDDLGFVMAARGQGARVDDTLRFTLEEIRRGGTVVYEAARGTLGLTKEGDTAVALLAPGIEAHYELTAEGVAQSFHFANRLPGSGDLVVRGRLATGPAEQSVQLLAGGGGEGLSLRAASGSAFQYGAVTGVGGAGSRAPGDVRLIGDRVTLTLPSEFVDRAELPLVLDPVIGPRDHAFPTGAYYEPRYPEIAFDDSNQRYFAVWSETGVPSDDVDLYGQFRDSTGAASGPLIMVAASPAWENHARVANVNATDRFIVTYREEDSLRARTVDASTGAVSSPVTLATSLTGVIQLAVGGDPLPPYDEALVAWIDREQTIWAQRVRCRAVGAPVPVGAPVLIESHPARELGRLSITKTNGASGRWMICWDRRVGPIFSATDNDVWMAVVDFTGRVAAGPSRLPSPVGEFELYPKCAGGGDAFAVVFAAPYDLYVQPLRISGTSVLPSATRKLVSTEPFVHQTADLERAGDEWIVCWNGPDPALAGYSSTVMGRALHGTTCTPIETPYRISDYHVGERKTRLDLFARSSSALSTNAPRQAMTVSAIEGGPSEFLDIRGTLVSTP